MLCVPGGAANTARQSFRRACAAVEPLGMGEMGERERLEQEHADKMRLKNRDESAVKVQFQIDAYKKVFAEQRLAASR